MRNKDLKKLLKKEASKVSIKDYTNEILNNVNHQPLVIENTKKNKKSHRALGFSLAGLTMVMASVLLIFFILRPTTIIPTPPGPGPSVDPTTPIGPGPITSLSKKEMVLSKEVVALGNAIESIGTINTNNSLLGYKSILLDSSDKEDDNEAFNGDENESTDVTLDYDSYKNIAYEMNTYLYAADSFINKDSIEVSVKENDNLNYPYDYLMHIIMNDTDFLKEYFLYYNEKKEDLNVEIEGIIMIDGISYEISGEREDNGDEVELELKLITGVNSYISIKNETEINENEYEYTFFKDGIIIKGVSMEIVNEKNERKAEIEIIENDLRKEFEFTYFEDYILSEYKDKDLELEIRINIFPTYYSYVYNDYEVNLDK